MRDLAVISLYSSAFSNCRRMALGFFDAITNTTSVTTSTDCYNVPGTSAWNNDPCCNPVTAMTTCCVGRSLNVTTIEYNFTDSQLVSEIGGSCLVPACLLQPMRNYRTVLATVSDEVCAARRTSVLTNPRFTTDYYGYCMGRIFPTPCGQNQDCLSIDPDSRCQFDSLTCSIPCDSDDGCYSGSCVGNVGNMTCVGLVLNDTDFELEALYNCTMDQVDPFLETLLNAELTRRPGNEPLYLKFATAITGYECVTPTNTTWPVPITNEEDCDAAAYCPWLFCAIGGPMISGNLPCSMENCLAAMPGPYCSYDRNDFVSYAVGRPPVCEMTIADAQIANASIAQTTCQGWGGSYAGADIANHGLFGPCLIPSIQSEEKCYDPDLCIPGYKGQNCTSYCYNDVATEAACTPTLQNYSQTWTTWTGSSATQSRCIISVSNYDQCLTAGGTWQTGFLFRPPIWNSPEECMDPARGGKGCWNHALVHLQNVSLDSCAKFECTACYGNMSGAVCTNKTACEASNSCNNPEGCVFSQSLSSKGLPCTWTSLGCVLSLSNSSCAKYSSQYLDQNSFETPNACLSHYICNDGTGAPIPDDPTALPPGYNSRNQSECVKCGGKWESSFAWKQSTWVQKQYPVPLHWKLNAVLTPQWRPILSPRAFTKLMDQARATRVSALVASELYCRGIEGEPIGTLAYACDEGPAATDKNTSNIEAINGNTISFIYACQGVPLVVDLGSVRFTTYENFTILSPDTDTNPCIKARIDVLNVNLFSFVRRTIPSSLMLVSESHKTTATRNHVYNANGAVVGMIATNGISLNYFDDRRFAYGFEVCIRLAAVSSVPWDLRADYYDWSLVLMDINDTTNTFVTTSIHYPINNSGTAQYICVNATGKSRVVFSSLMVRDWENVTIASSWSSSERGLIIFCVVMYFLLFLFAFVNLVLHVIMGENKGFPAPQLALTFVCTLAALGAAQLLSIYDGTVEGTQLSPLLSDLQSLMMISCVVMITITWSGIIASGKKLSEKKGVTVLGPLIFLLILWLLFVALLVASGTTTEDQNFTCATTDDEINATSASEALAIAYKAILACWAFVLASVFTWMSVEVFILLKSYKKLKQVVAKNMFASVTVLLALLVLVAITLYSTQSELENTTKLAFTITVLLLPSYSITYLYSVGSSFTTWKKWSGSGKSTSSRSSRTASKTSPSSNEK